MLCDYHQRIFASFHSPCEDQLACCSKRLFYLIIFLFIYFFLFDLFYLKVQDGSKLLSPLEKYKTSKNNTFFGFLFVSLVKAVLFTL